MRPRSLLTGAVLALLMLGQPAAAAVGDPERGAQVFRSCAACHSLEPGEHRTGPSLAGIFGHEAGTVPGFMRYSSALEAAEITWTEETLESWLADPQAMIPGNRMAFPGIGDGQARADLIAYLEAATAEGLRAGGSAGASPDMAIFADPAEISTFVEKRC